MARRESSKFQGGKAVEEVRRKKKKGWVFKVDFEKAYDNVEWDFLDFVLRKKGFGERWRKWIRGCVSNVSFSIMINGKPRGKFKSSRGLRQGDPLSLFLFNMVVDVLGSLIDKAKEVNLIKGFEVGREKLDVSHIQFADDSLFFVQQEVHLQFLVQILESFCAMSGLKINWDKSALLGLCQDEVEEEQIAEKLGCRRETWPITYLGVPLGGNPSKLSFWEPILNRINRKLATWKKGFLSKGGRLTLIAAVLNALPIYFMSLFKVPKGVAAKMEKMMRNFLWDGSDGESHCHLVRWEQVCKPKENGGLGIGNICLRNKSLLGKWWWRFGAENEPLWKRIIRSKYGLQENGWDAGLALNVTFKCPWKFISSIYPTYHRLVRLVVRGGITMYHYSPKNSSSFSNAMSQICVVQIFGCVR